MKPHFPRPAIAKRGALRHARRTLCALALATPLVLPFAAKADVPATQRAALVALYNATDGANWTNSDNWLTGDPCATGAVWNGITCDAAGDNVTRIDLSDNNLVGTLPDLTDLTVLERFQVGGNQLHGEIPALPTSLTYIALRQNQLSGELPDLSAFTQLQEFFAWDNQLSGPIPTLPASIRIFHVYRNHLSDEVPALPDGLQQFRVERNQLSGTVPAAPSSLTAANSYLCPNQFDLDDDADWDTATNATPWHTLCANYPGPYTITPVAQPTAGGTLTCTVATATHNGHVNCTAEAAPGYEFVDFEAGVCHSSSSGETCRLLNITDDLTVTANFQALPTYTLNPTVSMPAAATFECAPNPVPAGQTATCTLDITDPDYEFVSFQNCARIGTSLTCSVGPVDSSTPTTITANLRRIVAPAGAVPVPVNAPLMLVMLAGLLGFAAQRSRKLRK